MVTKASWNALVEKFCAFFFFILGINDPCRVTEIGLALNPRPLIPWAVQQARRTTGKRITRLSAPLGIELIY